MNVAHILLGRPWLYDRNVSHNGRENTYTFRYMNKNITLNPCQHREFLSSPGPKPSPTLSSLNSVSTPPRATISFLHHRPSERLGNSNKFFLTILARELALESIVFPNCLSETSQLRLMTYLKNLWMLSSRNFLVSSLPCVTYNMLLTWFLDPNSLTLLLIGWILLSEQNRIGRFNNYCLRTLFVTA